MVTASKRIHHVASVLRDAYGGLHDWRIWLYESDIPGHCDKAEGFTVLEPRYRKATITIKRNLKEVREREVVAHELAHVLFSSMDQAVDRITDLMTEREKIHAGELYSDVLEPLCEKISTAFLELIPEEAWVMPE